MRRRGAELREPPCRVTFNSLFEMPRRRQPGTPPASRLSILYLRCRGAETAGGAVQPRRRLSILYLRCVPVRAGPARAEGAGSFNSLFEMPSDADRGDPDTPQLSILYLRCTSTQIMSAPTGAKYLSILYLRCRLFLLTCQLTSLCAFQFSI